MRSMLTLLRFTMLAAALALVTGCSDDGPEVVPVEGVALHNDKPIPNLFITFQPESGRSSWGLTDENGRFKLNYNRERDGALVGKHKVYVRFRPSSPQEEYSGTFRPPAGFDEVVEKYGDIGSTTKEVEITSDQEELELTFD